MSQPIFFPDGFTEFVAMKDQERNGAKGQVLFLNEDSWMALPGHATMWSYVDQVMNQLDLNWKFGPHRLIRTDFLIDGAKPNNRQLNGMDMGESLFTSGK